MKGIRVVIEVDPTESWASPCETLEVLCDAVAHLVRVNHAACGVVSVRVMVDCGGIGHPAMQYMRNSHGIVCEPMPKTPKIVRREW